MQLVIDTSLPGIRLVLDGNAKMIDTDKQSVALPVLVEQFLAEHGAAFKDLSAIAVVTGPGSFTGIRLAIAYAKGLSIGLGIPVVPVNAFEIYLERNPDAFVAIDSNRGDFFVAAADMSPTIMTIDDVETEQMRYAATVGHRPYDLADALPIVKRKLESEIPPVIPLYIRPHYADTTGQSS
jgi:tRNA threonylcarbamoyl adenosine modification protein YeaZ